MKEIVVCIFPVDNPKQKKDFVDMMKSYPSDVLFKPDVINP